MLGVYVVLGIGIVVAFLTLIAEILWKRRQKHKLLAKTRFVAMETQIPIMGHGFHSRGKPFVRLSLFILMFLIEIIIRNKAIYHYHQTK